MEKGKEMALELKLTGSGKGEEKVLLDSQPGGRANARARHQDHYGALSKKTPSMHCGLRCVTNAAYSFLPFTRKTRQDKSHEHA